MNGKGLRFVAYYKSGEINLSDEHESYKWLKLNEAIDKFKDNDFEIDKKVTLQKVKEYLEMKNALRGWKRERADFENYKKRQIEERKDLIAFSNINLISELIPVLDNFHVSTDHIPQDQKENPWVTGIMYIQKQLEKVLEDNGVEEIKIEIGAKFDPNLMEAVKQESGDSKQEVSENKVKKVLMKGYKINSKVIRAARVIVR